MSRQEKRTIKTRLAAHGKAGCDDDEPLPVTATSGTSVTCLFGKFELEIECDPANKLVRVLGVRYARVRDRHAVISANPKLKELPFVHPRDRRTI